MPTISMQTLIYLLDFLFSYFTKYPLIFYQSTMGGGGEGERGNCLPFKKRKITRGNCDNLPPLLLMSEDVLIQVMSCLPVISLLRFKSVCKSWRSIIESPFFINLHATTTLLPSSSLFTKLGCSVFFNRGEEHEEEDKRGNICRLSGDEFVVFEDLGRPPLVKSGDEFEVLNRRFDGWLKFSVVGCCNGIICLHDYFSRDIVLWNPAIKQSRVVPKPSNLLGNRNWFDDDDDGYYVEDAVAFGVDAKTKDYKVLLITTLHPPHANYDDEHMKSPDERRVHVYSLSTDSWRCIDVTTVSAAHPELRLYKYIVDQGVHLTANNFFKADCLIKDQGYFCCTTPLILSFDFTEEIFRTIQPPYDDWRNKITFTDAYFIPFNEKIALVGAKQCGGFDIWVLNELNGVKESWTKMYTIEASYASLNKPLCIMNNGEVALCQGLGLHDVGKLRLLNLITGETKDIQSDCLGRVDLNVNIYKPSLVQIGRHKWCNNK